MKNAYVILVALIFLLCSCTTERTARDIAKDELRHKLFVECMDLAANMPRQADDDVSDIVEECGNQSYYISNGMSK